MARLLAQRWHDASLARRMASEIARTLLESAKLRCLPNGRPLPAAEVIREMERSLEIFDTTPAEYVERVVLRDIAGEPRSARSPAEITALIGAFLQCYAADYERGVNLG
ncbi:hypothetical protein ACFQU2_14510 [Siccirubricoccus deserti]